MDKNLTLLRILNIQRWIIDQEKSIHASVSL